MSKIQPAVTGTVDKQHLEGKNVPVRFTLISIQSGNGNGANFSGKATSPNKAKNKKRNTWLTGLSFLFVIGSTIKPTVFVFLSIACILRYLSKVACMYCVTSFSGVWINRVSLSILLVASTTRKLDVSLSTGLPNNGNVFWWRQPVSVATPRRWRSRNQRCGSITHSL